MNFKYLLSIILVLTLSFGMSSVAFAEESIEVPEDYTPIYTAEDLNNIRNNLSGKYILMNDIDLSSENWVPVGINTAPFTGIFDGNNLRINSLKISTENKNSGNSYYGLFGYAKNAEFKNISIKDSQINIKNLSEEVTRGYVGTIVGLGNNITISNSVVSGVINVSGFTYNGIGGIVGMVSMGKLDCCSNHSIINADISSSGIQASVGGISGIAASVEKRCSNHGDITVSGKDIADNCVVKVGGIDGNGSENMELSNSYNTGRISVSFSTKETFIGGLSGESYITKNSYNSGKIEYPENFNGFAGAISGNINSDVLYIGDGPGMKNVYYINDSLSPAYDGKTNFNDLTEDYRDEVFVNVKALSENEMMQQAFFEGFDFENVWSMEENGYAILDFEKTKQIPPEKPSIDLIDAKIVKIPCLKRIVFGQLPKSPEGITVELKYSDGTSVTDKIAANEDGYYINGESVTEAEYAAVEKYGIKNAVLYLNEEKIHLSYKYLCLPTTISGLFHMLYEIF